VYIVQRLQSPVYEIAWVQSCLDDVNRLLGRVQLDQTAACSLCFVSCFPDGTKQRIEVSGKIIIE
jgi:hypothetical protein